MELPYYIQLERAMSVIFFPVLLALAAVSAIAISDEHDDRRRIWADSLFRKRNVEMYEDRF